MRESFRYQRSRRQDDAAALTQPVRTTLKHAVSVYAIAASVVIAAAIWLPFIATDLAAAMGWTQSFVGTLFIALTTSLPELSVTIAAVRSGAIDMAIGNLIGSNLFNMVVLAVDSALYLPGVLLSSVSPVHVASVFAAIAMTGVVVIALIAPPRARFLNAVSWVGVILVLLFFGNTWYHFRHPG
jgi:cation:H+ antiporter